MGLLIIVRFIIIRLIKFYIIIFYYGGIGDLRGNKGGFSKDLGGGWPLFS